MGLLEVIMFGGAEGERLGELGCVQALFTDPFRNSRFMFDPGLPPDRVAEIYGFPYRAPAHKSLDILQDLEILPDLPNIYRHDYELERGVEVGPLPMDGFVVTHPHHDHIGALPYFRADMPIHMHSTSLSLAWTWQETSNPTQNQFIDYVDQLSPDPTGRRKVIHGHEARIPRDIRTFEDGETFKVGGMDITAYQVDHTVPGSCGFIMHTSIGDVGFTGDFRCRGGKPERTERYIQALERADLAALFIEGSLIHMEHEGNEDDVKQVVYDLIKDAGFAGIAYPPRDFDRVSSIYAAAKRDKRMLVVSPNQAFTLMHLNGIDGFPKMTHKYMGVHIPRKASYRDWEKILLKKQRWNGHKSSVIQRVELEDIRDNQDQFLLNLPFSGLPTMLQEIQPVNGMYIQSHPAPWNIELRLHQDRVINVLRQHGMYYGIVEDSLTPGEIRALHQAHVTGHHNYRETRIIVQRVLHRNPNCKIIPYHSLHPYLFKNFVPPDNLYIPKRRRKFELR